MAVLSWALAAAVTLFSAVAAFHALLTKRDSRAALGWIAVCLVFPFLGPVFYFLFGINRVRTRAREMHARYDFALGEVYDPLADEPGDDHPPPATDAVLPPDLAEIARVGSSVSRRALVEGNEVTVLHAGERAFPEMLAAIEAAEAFVYLTTYIFETNHTGRLFIDALAAASARGVDVRVMIDGVGEWYSWPRAGSLLRRRSVRVARFLPPKLLPPTVHINLRNHRKILVTDRGSAFTGGMNIGDRHLADDQSNPYRVVDAHFRLRGPIVSHFSRLFLDDWRFITGESIETPNIVVDKAGTAVCRTIVDGPDEDFDKLLMVLIGIVSVARRRLLVMTPYFLPPAGLVAAMQAAALRGVDVSVILPERSNLPYVHWATRNMLWELVQRGVRVYEQPAPFVHTKLLVMDEAYSQIGSANIDPRSLRLNFEVAVEVYDRNLASTLAAHFEDVRQRSRRVTLHELASRPLGTRTRDAAAWLFSPYL